MITTNFRALRQPSQNTELTYDAHGTLSFTRLECLPFASRLTPVQPLGGLRWIFEQELATTVALTLMPMHHNGHIILSSSSAVTSGTRSWAIQSQGIPIGPSSSSKIVSAP